MWPAGAFLLAFGAYCLWVPNRPLVVEVPGMALRFLIEGGAFLWAARRPELPAQLRWTLRLCGAGALYSIGTLGMEVAQLPFAAFAGAVSYVFALVAFLAYPRVPFRSRQGATVAIDLVTVAGALSVLQWFVISAAPVDGTFHRGWAVTYGVAQVAVMAGLSGVINLGRAVPSVRAFWWFVAAESVYLPVAVLAQFHALYQLPWAEPVARFIYFVGVLATLRAAVHFRGDPVAAVPDRVSPAWLLGLNPLTFLMPAALGTALTLALWRGPADKVVPLGLSLLTVTLLLVLRLVVTAYQNARLQEEERAADERLLQVRQEERVRLLADMHDGFGSQLVSARIRVSRAELDRGQLEGVLAECLADLALVTDSIKAQDDSLETALADWRARLDERLEGHGCRLHWTVELGQVPKLPSGHILQVLRVLQEAVGNALRHAQAENTWIEVRSERRGPLSVTVLDDGVGLSPGAVGGRGMEFMRKRAGNVGGLLTFSPGRGGRGTSVRLEIPVQA
ncbi:MAG: hypothetical protein RL653_523 [Pseudomonadota bacterium]|jgi:signal transduction histidine kinase